MDSPRHCRWQQYDRGLLVVYTYNPPPFTRKMDPLTLTKKPFALSTPYDDRIVCKASCCWGCKEDHVEARVDGGSVCCSCLSKFTILLAVCSEARSFPPHRTCNPTIHQDLISLKNSRISQTKDRIIMGLGNNYMCHIAITGIFTLKEIA